MVKHLYKDKFNNSFHTPDNFLVRDRTTDNVPEQDRFKDDEWCVL